jgi:hypothetical protein
MKLLNRKPKNRSREPSAEAQRLIAWENFNHWEDESRHLTLAELTPEESIRQFFELYELAWTLANAGPNVEYLKNVETNPHLRDLIEWKRTVEKARGKC